MIQKALATGTLGLLMVISGLAEAQYNFVTIDMPDGASVATSTAANGISTHEIVGEFTDLQGFSHGFLLNKGVFTVSTR